MRGWDRAYPPPGPVRVNEDSEQALGLQNWLPGQASRGLAILRDKNGKSDGPFAGASTDPVWVQHPELGWGLDYDGSNDFLALQNGNDPTGNVTIGALVYPETIAGSQRAIYSCGNGGAAGNHFTILNTTSKVRWGWDGGVTWHDGNTAVSINEPHAIVVVRQGSTGNWAWRIYLDGKLDAEGTGATENPSATSIVSIGQLGNANLWRWNGIIFDVRVYTRAFDELAGLMWDPRTRWDLYEATHRMVFRAAGLVLKSAADTGVGTDAASVSASATLADTGAGVDAPSVAASATITDTGAGLEGAPAVEASATHPDTGVGVEGTPQIGQTPGDTGSGSEGATLAQTIADTGAGTDVGQVSQAIIDAINETGIGTDAASKLVVGDTNVMSPSWATFVVARKPEATFLLAASPWATFTGGA